MNIYHEENFKIQTLAYEFMNAPNLRALFEAAVNHIDFLDDFKAVTVANDFDREIDPNNINVAMVKYSKYVTSYFPSAMLYFFSKDIVVNMLKGGDVPISIDYTVMFDSNFATYIHKLVNKIKMQVPQDFYSIVKEIIKDKWNFDYTFYLIESYKTLLGIENVRESKQYLAILANVKSLELFKNINSEYYEKSGEITYLINEEAAENSARDLCELFYLGEESEKLLNHYYLTKQFILLALIGMVRIKFENNKSADNKMHSYFDFVKKNIGLNLERETLLAYEYFKNTSNLYILRKITRDKEREDIYIMLDNIAWDFMIPRVMESVMTYMAEGDFILPYFLSFDDASIRLLKMIEPKGVIIDEKNMHTVPYMNNDYLNHFKNEKLCNSIKNIFNPLNADTRLDTYQTTKEKLDETIQIELNLLFESIH